MNEPTRNKEDIKETQSGIAEVDTQVFKHGAGDGVTSLLDIQNAINTRLKKLESLKEDLKPYREMLDSIFANDEDYVEKSKIVREAGKNKSEAKKRILRQPQAAELSQKIEELKSEARDIQEGLSYYLREYQMLTGASEFESEDGELRQIVYIAKLVRKTDLNE